MNSPTLHAEERRQFERLLSQLHQDRIADRLAVVDAFLTVEEHHSVAGWQRVLKERGVELEAEFVAETLELLNQYGLATRRDFEGGPPRYEHRHLDEHHDHLICTCCGSITEFSDPRLEALQDEIAARHGFHCLRHRHQIYGLCARCLARRRPALPLAMASPGERVKVVEIKGGDQAGRQLLDLGITVGAELLIISAQHGPLVVAVRGTRVALGRGLAQKVLVSPVAGCGCDGRGGAGTSHN